VDYYHRLFKSLNLKPEDIQTSNDLTKLPVLKKIDVQKNPMMFHAKNVNEKQCLTRKTSGSTGIPFSIIFDSNAQSKRESRYFRSYFACGLKLKDKIYQISRYTAVGHKKHWYNYFGFLKREYISVFDPLGVIIDCLVEAAPSVIEGYPSILVLLAEELENNKNYHVHPDLIFTSAELLTDSFRNKIESGFGGKVFDRYGSVEFNVFAWECKKHEGYHLDVEDLVVEFLRDGEPVAPGEKGEVVVTGLSNFAMPLIRYSLGDIATSSDEKCSCGRGLPLMRMIDGRTDDFLVLPSGKTISPRTVNYYFLCEDVKGLKRLKIVQEKRDKIRVSVVLENDLNEDTISKIRNIILKGCLGENIEVIVEQVEKIPRDNSGKIRIIESKVK
jgi:phenylacetate-CoA ligase